MVSFCVLATALIALDYFGYIGASVTNSRVTLATSFYQLIDSPRSVYASINARFYTRQSLLHENQLLKQKNYILQSQLNAAQSLYQENNNLRALLQTTTRIGSRYLIAELAAVNVDPMMQHIVVKRGLSDGISKTLPVVDATGVIGQVIQVGQHMSKVMLLSDRRSTIPVTIARNGVRGLVSGTNDPSSLEMLYMPESSDLRPGDQLLSSHLGGLYPNGYPVGTITKVMRTGQQTFARVFVTPAARLHNNEHVLILWPNPNKVSLATFMPLPLANTATAIAPSATVPQSTPSIPIASPATPASSATTAPAAQQPPLVSSGNSNTAAAANTNTAVAAPGAATANPEVKKTEETKKNKAKAKVKLVKPKVDDDIDESVDTDENSDEQMGNAVEWKENI